MAATRRTTKNSRGADTVFGYLIPLTLVGLAIADFQRDGQIDKYLIGALLIVGLGALGYRIDTIIEAYLTAKGGGGAPSPQEKPNANDSGDANAR